MTAGRSEMRGFSILELLVAAAVTLGVVGTAMFVYSQARATAVAVTARTNIQSNLRLSMEQVTRDLRALGFGVPEGVREGGSDLWAPALFHATATTLAFRADVDGGNAAITCTPNGASTLCPRDKLHVDRIDYYDDLGCLAADGSGGALKLVAAFDDDVWSPLTCSSANAAQLRLTTSTLPDRLFEGGRSGVYSIEQVYLRFVPGSAPDYGRLERAVVYDNVPSDTFPPVAVSWEPVARHLTDLLFEYRDVTGAALGTTPLSAADRARVRSIAVVLEGFDRPRADGRAHTIPLRSWVTLRNIR